MTASAGVLSATVGPVPGMVWLGRASASGSASITICASGCTITASLGSTYEEYEVHLINVLPATNSADLWLRVSTNGGSSYDAGGTSYQYTNGYFEIGGPSGTGSASAGQMLVNSGTAHLASAGAGLSGTVTGYSLAATGNKQFASRGLVYDSVNANSLDAGSGAGKYVGSTAAINALQFLSSSGNLASGDFVVYGLRKQ